LAAAGRPTKAGPGGPRSQRRRPGFTPVETLGITPPARLSNLQAIDREVPFRTFAKGAGRPAYMCISDVGIEQ
jgi:hypothetical protein